MEHKADPVLNPGHSELPHLSTFVEGRGARELHGCRCWPRASRKRPSVSESLPSKASRSTPWRGNRSSSASRVPAPVVPWRRASGGPVGRSRSSTSRSDELGSNVAIKDAVKRGLGVAFLSRFCVQRELGSKELRAVAVRGLCLTRHFYLVYHRHRPLSQAASVFLHFIESHPISQPPAKQRP